MSIVFRNLRERFAAPTTPIVIDDDEDINGDQVNQGLYAKISLRAKRNNLEVGITNKNLNSNF